MDAVGLCNLSFCLQYGIFITVNSAERVELGTRKIYFFTAPWKKSFVFFRTSWKTKHSDGAAIFYAVFFSCFFLPFFLCFSSSLYLWLEIKMKSFVAPWGRFFFFYCLIFWVSNICVFCRVKPNFTNTTCIYEASHQGALSNFRLYGMYAEGGFFFKAVKKSCCKKIFRAADLPWKKIVSGPFPKSVHV